MRMRAARQCTPAAASVPQSRPVSVDCRIPWRAVWSRVPEYARRNEPSEYPSVLRHATRIIGLDFVLIVAATLGRRYQPSFPIESSVVTRRFAETESDEDGEIRVYRRAGRLVNRTLSAVSFEEREKNKQKGKKKKNRTGRESPRGMPDRRARWCVPR